MAYPQPTVGERSLFPTLAARAYLNHAGVGPLALPVQAAIEVALRDTAAHGIGATMRGLERMEILRGKVASMLAVEVDEVGFIPNTTAGVNLVSLSMPWKPGDRVVLFEGEFPANITPWQEVARLFDLELEFVPVAPFHQGIEEGLAVLEPVLQKGVRLLAVSLVQFQTGLRMPIRAIAERVHTAGGEVFVDGIQGIGVLPFAPAAEGADYVACGGHKWLLGIQGGGFLYARKTCVERWVPRTFGWISHLDPVDFLFCGAGHLRYDRPFRKEASVVEGGSPSFLGMAALEAAVDMLAAVGLEQIFEHVQGYHDALEPHLAELGFESLRAANPAQRSGTLSARPPMGCDATTLVPKLQEAGIIASLPDGNVRFAPHFPNSMEEIPAVVTAMESWLRSEGPRRRTA